MQTNTLLALIPDSTDTYPITHSLLNSQNVIAVRFAQSIAHLKIPPHHTHFDYYSIAMQFNILSLSEFYIFSFGFVCRDKGHLQMTDSD